MNASMLTQAFSSELP